MLHRAGFPTALRNGMEHTNTDAIPFKIGSRLTVKGVGHFSLCIAGNAAAPEVIDVAFAAGDIEREAEGIWFNFLLEIRKLWQHCGPIFIPDRGVYAANDLMIPQPEPF